MDSTGLHWTPYELSANFFGFWQRVQWESIWNPYAFLSLKNCTGVDWSLPIFGDKYGDLTLTLNDPIKISNSDIF
jgi:hypothetical protein